MKKINRAQISIIGFFILATFCVAFYLSRNENSKEAMAGNREIVISHESGFYNESILLEIEGDEIEDVLYTIDGSKPSKDNPTALLYTEGIYLACESEESVHTIRLIGYYEDGSATDIITRSFILGNNIEERYDTLVLTVTATDEFFFDPEHGKMTSQEAKDGRGREYEGEVFMTLYSEGGEILLAQNCGFRLFGNFSREKNQRSFRLYGRLEYDEENEFDYAFFDNQYSINNTLINEYKRLDIRNAGQDNGFAFIRGEFATRLCLEAGYPDAPSATPVAVYLNNEYYGCYWIITNFNETYYTNKYGDYEGTMYTFSGRTNHLEVDEDETDEMECSLIEEYNATMSEFVASDLTEEEKWEALNEFMDVENFLQYCAIQHYIGNTDSFFNNYKIYRYVAPEGGEYTENSVFDGRYRFILFDLDWGFGLQSGDFITSVEDLTTTERMNSTREDYLLFQKLMEREDCREYYIRFMLSMQNYYFSYDYANGILEEMHESRIKELRYTYLTTDLYVNNTLAPDVTSDLEIEREMDVIRDFLQNRKYYIKEDLSGCFGPFTTYDLYLYNEGMANVTLDYAIVNDSEFTGMYYKEVPLNVSVQARPGYKFDYWIVNGEKYSETSFEITQDMLNGDRFEITCVSSPDPAVGLMITEVKTRNGEDYIQLTNMGTVTQNMKDYFLTDDETWNKAKLPAITLEPGESIIIYCENYTGLEALGQPYVKFNLKDGEQLSLYGSEQQLIQSVDIPLLGVEDSVYSMDMSNGTFKEVRKY